MSNLEYNGKSETTVEHRYYPRLDASLKVGVFKGDELLGYFTTRNISLDGLFIEMPQDVLTINDVIGILIGVNGDAHMQKGIVVHHSAQGVGVMLIDLDKQVFQGIFNLFRHQQLPIGRVLDGIDRRMPAVIQKALPARFNVDTSSLPHDRKRPHQFATAGSQRTRSPGIVIRTGRRFDISSTLLFRRAIKAIHALSPRIVVIDMTRTEYLFDSGLALLLMLKRETHQLRYRIHFIHGDPLIADRLVDAGFAASLHTP